MNIMKTTGKQLNAINKFSKEINLIEDKFRKSFFNF